MSSASVLYPVVSETDSCQASWLLCFLLLALSYSVFLPLQWQTVLRKVSKLLLIFSLKVKCGDVKQGDVSGTVRRSYTVRYWAILARSLCYESAYHQNDRNRNDVLFWGRNVAQRCLNTFLFLLFFSCVLCVGRRWSMCSTSTCPPAPACWTWHWPTTTSTAAAAYPLPSTEKWPLLTAAPRQSTTTRSTTHKRLHQTMNSWEAQQPLIEVSLKTGHFWSECPDSFWNTKRTETRERNQRSTHLKTTPHLVCVFYEFTSSLWTDRLPALFKVLSCAILSKSYVG